MRDSSAKLHYLGLYIGGSLFKYFIYQERHTSICFFFKGEKKKKHLFYIDAELLRETGLKAVTFLWGPP